MDRISGPQHVREGVLEALAQGVGVTAKISWLTHASRGHQNGHSDNDSASVASGSTEFVEGKPRWIHCTPLQGSDCKAGVIMVVMVDKEEMTGALNGNSHTASPRHARSRQILRHADYTREGWPLRSLSSTRDGAGKYTGSKLYADYLRREGRSGSREEERTVVGGAGVMGRLESPAPSGRSNGSLAVRRSISMRTREGREMG